MHVAFDIEVFAEGVHGALDAALGAFVAEGLQLAVDFAHGGFAPFRDAAQDVQVEQGGGDAVFLCHSGVWCGG